VTAVVRNLFRAAASDAPIATSVPAVEPSTDDLIGGDCQCGRGPAIGTCVVTDTRLRFRAFHELPAVYHLHRVTDWACVDCVADAALDVANGVIKEQMRKVGRERAEEMAALKQQNEMRRAAGLPTVPEAIIPEGFDEWVSEGLSGGNR